MNRVTPAAAPRLRAEAVRLHRAGDLAGAEPLYHALIAADRRDPELRYLLALLRFGQERFPEAVAAARHALRLRPADGSAAMLIGLAEAARGRLEAAVRAYDGALAAAPDRWDVHANRAAALLGLGRAAEALADCDRALAGNPDSAEAHANRGDALLRLGRLGEAHAAFEAALALGLDGAREKRDALLEPEPGEAVGRLNARAVLLAELGRIDDALATLDRAIAEAPHEPVLLYNFGLFGRFTPGHPHLAALTAMDPAGLDDRGARYLHFARAKAAADLGQADAAFGHLLEGNALVRAGLAHDPAHHEGLVERVRAAFPPGPTSTGDAEDPAAVRPVFVVGVPRSGSTLVERVLSGHPRAAAAGEIDAFRAALGTAVPFPEAAARLAPADLRALGARYRARLPRVPAGTAAVVDKTLVNVWYVGLIHRALPEARFVHAVRDPLDAGLSCFEQLFNTEQTFAYDLGDIGRYQRAVAAVAAHWRLVLPPCVMIELRYEDLVSDLEGAARRLLAHAGLAWDPACLDTGRAGGRVDTASIAQVRRPVSGGSVGRWRRYARHLGPLRAALGLDAEGRPEAPPGA